MILCVLECPDEVYIAALSLALSLVDLWENYSRLSDWPNKMPAQRIPPSPSSSNDRESSEEVEVVENKGDARAALTADETDDDEVRMHGPTTVPALVRDSHPQLVHRDEADD
jgi:hypothetical protein